MRPVWLACVLACGGLAAEATTLKEDALDLRIAVSPEGQAKEEARAAARASDLFRRAQAGEPGADRRWQALAEAERAAGLSRVLLGSTKDLKAAALDELSAMGSGDSNLPTEARRTVVRAAAYAAVHEDDPKLSVSARETWKKLAAGDATAIEEMAAGLNLDNAIEQARAFEALKALGGERVLGAMITKVVERWGKFPRSHIVVGTQTSYIADYDVSGAVYDPVIRSYWTGVVLDTQILEVVIATYIAQELRRLGAGEQIANNPREWRAFLRKRE